jgi:hypothetical protein
MAQMVKRIVGHDEVHASWREHETFYRKDGGYDVVEALLRSSFQKTLDHRRAHVDRHYLLRYPSERKGHLSGAAAEVHSDGGSSCCRAIEDDVDHPPETVCTFMLPGLDSPVPQVLLVTGRGGGVTPLR